MESLYTTNLILNSPFLKTSMVFEYKLIIFKLFKTNLG